MMEETLELYKKHKGDQKLQEEQENLGRSYMDMEHINMFFNVVKRNYWQRIIFMQYKRLPRVCVTEYVR